MKRFGASAVGLAGPNLGDGTDNGPYLGTKHVSR